MQAIMGKYPNALPISKLLDRIVNGLQRDGLKSGHTIPAYAMCRDESTSSIRTEFIRRGFPEGFTLNTLTGLPVTGKASLVAYYQHLMDHGAPGVIVFAPHVGYSHEGGWGTLFRGGITQLSKSCGANHALIAHWRLAEYGPYSDDFELSEISRLMVGYINTILIDKNPILKIVEIEHELGYKMLLRSLQNIVKQEKIKHPILVVSGVFIETDRPSDYKSIRSTSDFFHLRNMGWITSK